MKNKKLDEHAFDVLTPEAAYWVGFALGDGNVHKNKFSVRLKGSDVAHLEKLKAFLKSSNKVCHGITKPCMIGDKLVSPKEYANFSVSSPVLVARLAEMGVVPRKSLIASIPEELRNSRDVYRGLIDADGHIVIRQRKAYLPGDFVCTKYGQKARVDVRISLIGSIHVVSQFRDYVVSIEPQITNKVSKRGTIFSFEVGGESAQRLTAHFYNDAVVSLDRKLATAKEIISTSIGITTQ